MIILLTPTMLATDLVTAARYKMASILKISPAIIKVTWFHREGGGLGVEFAVDGDQNELGVTGEAIQAVIQTVWNLEYKRKLEWTLDNLKSVRQ